MNAIPQQNHQPSTALTAFDVTTPGSIEHVQTLAKIFADGGIAVPEHFRGKPGACALVIIQALQWGLNPVAVLQKTHITQGGALGYESQLLMAVITKNAPITGRVEFRYEGDWTKVLGKCEERKSEKSGGKYYVATYTKKDEEGLGVSISATFVGEDKPREMTVWMGQAWPRFSTQWASDPQQQLTYLAIRKWARRFTPETILGAYTPDEIASREYDMGSVVEIPFDERDVDQPPPMAGNAGLKQRMRAKGPTTSTTPPAPPPTPPTLVQVLKAIKDAKDRVELAAAAALAERLKSDKDKEVARTAWDDRREAGRAAARAAKQGEQPDLNEGAQPAAADDVGPDERVEPMKYPEVRAQLEAATDLEEAAVAADLIRFVDPKFQDELRVLYQEIVAKFEGDA